MIPDLFTLIIGVAFSGFVAVSAVSTTKNGTIVFWVIVGIALAGFAGLEFRVLANLWPVRTRIARIRAERDYVRASIELETEQELMEAHRRSRSTAEQLTVAEVRPEPGETSWTEGPTEDEPDRSA
jgi:hypothetical protein